MRLDLARPATGEGPFPVVVFFPGNSWGWLTKGAPPESMWTFRMYDEAIQFCARKGYVAVTVETRGVNIKQGGGMLFRFPTAIEDAKRAVRWLNANDGSYHLRTDRIVSIGWSSGGTLSLFLALTRPEDGFEGSGGNPGLSSQVAGAVSIAGVTDMAA